MSNLLDAFEEIVGCYDFKGDYFRKRSYEKALRILRGLGDVKDIKEVQGVAGFGPSTIHDITQILSTGTCDRLDELRRECPPKSVSELTKIPGVGPKTATKIWKDHGVKNLQELKAKLDSGEIVEPKWKSGIDFALTSAARTPIGFVLPLVQPILDKIRNLKVIVGFPDNQHEEQIRAEFAGSLRRKQETIGDVDILVRVPEMTNEANFSQLKTDIKAILGDAVIDAEGDRKIRSRVNGLQIDILFVPDYEYGAALQYFTGSKEHNVVLRTMAKQRDLLLNEKGLFKGLECIASETEKDIYKALNVPFLPPELRQDGSEIGKTAPELIKTEDIKGLLHNHTDWSDGSASIEETIQAARQRGLKYIAITDHSKAMAICNGLIRERIQQQIEKIKKLREKYTDIQILISSEMDVLSAGECDHDDDIIMEFDFVLLALHRNPRVNIADRFITAIEHLRDIGYTKPIILAHPSGRQFGKGPIGETDWDKLFQVCKEKSVILEINSLPERLDLDYSLCKKAKKKGIKFSISTDSHAIDNMDLVEYGINVARRAALSKEEVINTKDTF